MYIEFDAKKIEMIPRNDTEIIITADVDISELINKFTSWEIIENFKELGFLYEAIQEEFEKKNKELLK